MRRIVMALVIVAVGLGCSVADAEITSPGSGSGGATASRLQTVSIDAMAQDPSQSLLPGTTADAAFAVDNPNAQPITLVSVTQSGSISVAGGSGCTLANSGVTFTNQTGLSISVPANVTDYEVDLLNTMSMASSSSSGCQNATFSVPITITAQQG